MKATAPWPRVARENAITALRCAVASWFALWWLNAGIGGRHMQKSCSDEAALARMGALAAIEHACVHLAGAASLADSADFESKGCVRSILDV